MNASVARSCGVGLIAAAALLAAVPAAAQTPMRPWSAEVSVGWDNGVSGNVLSAGIGTLFGAPAIIREQSYGDIYGTGVRWTFGAGYMIRERLEITGTYNYSSASADVRQIGSVADSALFATFDDYNVWGIEAGARYYFLPPRQAPRLRPYAGAAIGVSVISEIDSDLAVPALGETLNATDFYDQTGAFTFSLNGGALVELHERVDFNLQLGFRFVGGLAQVDGLVDTGLEDINDDSGRWTLPLTVGLRFKF